MAIRTVDLGEPLLLRPALASGGRLLMVSDSPEDVPRHGVMYRDTASRPFRVFLHHLNATGRTAGIYIYLRNPAGQPVTVTARATGAGWGRSPAMVGCAAAGAYLANRAAAPVRLPPGSYTRWGLDRLAAGEVFSGTYDFDPEGPVQVHVALIPPGSQPNPQELPILPRDGVHVRGTWSHGGRRGGLAFRASLGFAGLQLGNAPAMTGGTPWGTPLPGEYETGHSAPDYRAEELDGNYGVVYQLDLRLLNDTPAARTVDLVMQPRGGTFCSALELDHQVTRMDEMITTPQRSWWPGQFGLAAGAQRMVTMRWIPPGGSALPVRLHLLSR